MKNENVNEGASLSKQRKQSRKEEIAKQKKMAVLRKVIWIAAAVLVIGLIVWVAISSSKNKANTVVASNNYSEQLNKDGSIKGVKPSSYIDIPDYSSISAALSDLEMTDEEVEAEIQNALNANKNLETSEELVAADGDEVNIDFAGSVDGVAFDGGTAEGYDITLGTNTFIDDFEAQIEGHHVGDEFDVEVTFPEDYGTEDLAGKDAVFAVKLNGIYVAPEFTDEFVQDKLADYASTAEGYRQYLKDTKYASNLYTYVQDYLVDNSTLKDTPAKYEKQLEANYKAYEYSNFDYMSQMYTSYYGYSPYGTFTDYLSQMYGQTEAEYDASLGEKVTENMKYVLACLAVADKEGITATCDESRAHYLEEGGTEENFETMLSTYGEGYMAQQMLCEKVVEMLEGRVTVK